MTISVLHQGAWSQRWVMALECKQPQALWVMRSWHIVRDEEVKEGVMGRCRLKMERYGWLERVRGVDGIEDRGI